MSQNCVLCPRKCNIDREKSTGFCGCSDLPFIARAAPHFGEEPCISGVNGSGAIFFSGCNLKCVYCQNSEISRHETGTRVDSSKLAEIILKLQDEGVHNINFVTGTHFTDTIAEAIKKASPGIPVIWNSSAYESIETLRKLEGIVDVWLPDYKYFDGKIAKKYSFAEDYPEIALAAIKEMLRQSGPYKLNEAGLIESGVIIRHLILPREYENTMNVIDSVADSFPSGSVLFSLMSQYTPMKDFKDYPELNETVSEEQSDALKHYMILRGLEGYCQDVNSTGKNMIPDFKESKI